MEGSSIFKRKIGKTVNHFGADVRVETILYKQYKNNTHITCHNNNFNEKTTEKCIFPIDKKVL